MTDKTKILCFLDNDYGRDVEILMPVIYFAEKHLNCNIELAFIWEIHKIYTKKPDLVLLSNTVGSALHFKISKYAYENHIKVFALISEGNYRTDGTFDYWGHNTDKMYYQEYICHWSERTCNFLKKEIPQYKDKMVVTGATGFDRYSIYNFISKKEYLKNKGLSQYKKVIGYAGWSFGKMYYKQGRKNINFIFKNPNTTIEWMEKQMYKVGDILRKTIENNPDILFILKRHPNETNESITKPVMNEMIRLKDYPNVLYITENENIHDLINISDIWMAFESTTTMEAWLLNKKHTILINPDTNFNRDKLYQGSLIVHNSQELQRAIDEFYKKGEIPAFNTKEKIKMRKQLIFETIEYDDGLNHLRTGYYLKKVIDNIQPNNNKKIRFHLKYFIRYALVYIGKYFYNKKLFLKLPKFRKTVWIFERFEFKKFWILKEKYYKYLDEFYKKNSLNEKIKQKEFWEKLINQKY